MYYFPLLKLFICWLFCKNKKWLWVRLLSQPRALWREKCPERAAKSCSRFHTGGQRKGGFCSVLRLNEIQTITNTHTVLTRVPQSAIWQQRRQKNKNKINTDDVVSLSFFARCPTQSFQRLASKTIPVPTELNKGNDRSFFLKSQGRARLTCCQETSGCRIEHDGIILNTDVWTAASRRLRQEIKGDRGAAWKAKGSRK